MHDELSAGKRDIIHARSAAAAGRNTFLHKRSLKCRTVADSLEEAGERLFCFTRLDPAQWRSVRTTTAMDVPMETPDEADQDPDRPPPVPRRRPCCSGHDRHQDGSRCINQMHQCGRLGNPVPAHPADAPWLARLMRQHGTVFGERSSDNFYRLRDITLLAHPPMSCCASPG